MSINPKPTMNNCCRQHQGSCVGIFKQLQASAIASLPNAMGSKVRQHGKAHAHAYSVCNMGGSMRQLHALCEDGRPVHQ